jgi:hypothetical protein
MNRFHYAQFYHPSTGYVEGSSPPRFDGERKLIEACGSDSILYLDGRLSLRNMSIKAEELARSRGYQAYQIRVGNFKWHAPLTPMNVLTAPQL